jgi:hypothetical protein
VSEAAYHPLHSLIVAIVISERGQEGEAEEGEAEEGREGEDGEAEEGERDRGDD